MPVESCAICGNTEWENLYVGPIRVGGPGKLSSKPRTILRCVHCSAGRLTGDTNVDYESAEYRKLVDDDESAQGYYALHDNEQSRKLELIGVDRLRNRIIADIGCGAGSFLDVVKGVSRETIAIEPAAAYRQELSAKGHVVYPYCKDVPEEHRGRVDVAVCFSVIEHVDDPLELLQDIRRLLKPGGQLILSTPNTREWLLELLPVEYGSFFFRVVHQWYLDKQSIEILTKRAGYTRSEFRFVQRFDMSNFLLWLRDRKPTGLRKISVPGPIDAGFCRWLEDTERSDYIYVTLTA